MNTGHQSNSRRWRKFRRHPQKFLSDSASAMLRSVGGFLIRHPAIERLVRETVYDPREMTGRLIATPSAGSRSVQHGIDVIMPCYNNAATVEPAIASILGQTLRPRRLIIVDDGSHDGSVDIIRNAAAHDARIGLICLPSNRGAAFARNTGLSISDAELVTFQDADDWSHPRRLERQFQRLNTQDRIAVTCDGCRIVDGGPVEMDGHYYHELSISVLFRRVPVLSRVGYIRSLTIAEDVDYLARIRAAFGADAVDHLQACLYFAALREGSAIFAHGEVRRVAARSYVYLPSEETRRMLQAVAGPPVSPDSIFVPFDAPDGIGRRTAGTGQAQP